MVINAFEGDDDPITFPSWQIYRCTVRILYISGPVINLEDFKFITKENTIKDFVMHSDFIQGTDGEKVPLHIILQYLPNAESIAFLANEPAVTSNTLEAMIQIKFWNPLRGFWLAIGEELNPELLSTFIQINAAVNSRWVLFFGDKNHIEPIWNRIKQMLDEWGIGKPTVEIRHD